MSIFAVRSHSANNMLTFKLLWSLCGMSLQITEKLHPVLLQHKCVMLRRPWIIGERGKEQLRSGWMGQWATQCSWRCLWPWLEDLSRSLPPKPLCDSAKREMVHRGLLAAQCGHSYSPKTIIVKDAAENLFWSLKYFAMSLFLSRRGKKGCQCQWSNSLAMSISQSGQIQLFQCSKAPSGSHPETSPIKQPTHHLEVPPALNMCELKAVLQYLCNP